MHGIDALQSLLAMDGLRMDALAAVESLALPDCWIGAGFVRDAVWDSLHGYAPRMPINDIDVVWFDLTGADEAYDRDMEAMLRRLSAGLRWSVKNQRRMHVRNGDQPYASVADAMRRWPETATAVATRRGVGGQIEINAPLGLDDLFSLQLRPTPAFARIKRPIFQQRVAKRRWMERYPLLTLADADCDGSGQD